MNETKEHIEMKETEDSKLFNSNEKKLMLEEQMVTRLMSDFEGFLLELLSIGVALSCKDLSELVLKALAGIGDREVIVEVLSKALKDYNDKLPDNAEVTKETKEEPKGAK